MHRLYDYLAVTAGCMLFSLVLASPIVDSTVSSDLVVDVGYAKYKGFYNNFLDTNGWLGMRYAYQPQRFQRARLPTSSGTSETVEAYTKGEYCSQVSTSAGQLVSQSIPGSEDCLFLDVYSPKNATKSRKPAPVVVWIHGGGYGLGYPDAFGNASDVIPVDQGETVLVVIQYRLSMFGFLSSNEIQKQGSPNLGIYDQLLAIQWVHENIAKFGGNPDHVTIWGQSAGGGSVMLLDQAYGGALNTSLWRGTISNSPYLPLQYDYNDTIPQGYYDAMVMASGCGGENDTFACLSAAPYEIVFEATVNVTKAIAPYATWGPAPVTDGVLLLDVPSAALFPGQVNGEYIYVGHLTHEGDIFVPPDLDTTNNFQSWFDMLYPKINPVVRELIFQVYPEPTQSNGSYSTQTQRAAAIYGDSTFVCPAYWLALAYPRGKGWKYVDAIGTGYHGSDIYDVFAAVPNSGYDLASTRNFLVGSLSSFWQNYNPAYSVALRGLGYAPYDTATKYQQIFYNLTATNETYAYLTHEVMREPEKCLFWRAIGPQVPG